MVQLESNGVVTREEGTRAQTDLKRMYLMCDARVRCLCRGLWRDEQEGSAGSGGTTGEEAGPGGDGGGVRDVCDIRRGEEAGEGR